MEFPQQVEQRLVTVRTLRRTEVRSVADRGLGRIDPEGLQAILEVIEKNEKSMQDDAK